MKVGHIEVGLPPIRLYRGEDLLKPKKSRYGETVAETIAHG